MPRFNLVLALLCVAQGIRVSHAEANFTVPNCAGHNRTSGETELMQPVKKSKYIIVDYQGMLEGMSGRKDWQYVRNLCVNYSLEMVGINHWEDWESLQEMMRHMFVVWNITGKVGVGQGDTVLVTGIRYMIPENIFINEPNSNTGSVSPGFVVWGYPYPSVDPYNNVTNATNGTHFVNYTNYNEVDLAVNFHKFGHPEQLYLHARDTSFYQNKTPSDTYFAVCQYPQHNKCFEDSAEEQKNKAQGRKPQAQRIAFVPKGIAYITNLPLSYHDALTFCTEPANFQLIAGATLSMWDGVWESIMGKVPKGVSNVRLLARLKYLLNEIGVGPDVTSLFHTANLINPHSRINLLPRPFEAKKTSGAHAICLLQFMKYQG